MGQKSDLITELEQFRDLVNTRHQTTPNTVYTSIYDFMLKEGKMYTSQELTKQEQEIVNQAIDNLYFTPKQKECFKNAQMLCLFDDSEQIKYVDGYARPNTLGINFLHAWNEINGKVIDITWLVGEKGAKKNNIGLLYDTEYFGINFSKSQIIDRIEQLDGHYSLIDLNPNLLTKKYQL